jgi:hypothetical protein
MDRLWVGVDMLSAAEMVGVEEDRKVKAFGCVMTGRRHGTFRILVGGTKCRAK